MYLSSDILFLEEEPTYTIYNSAWNTALMVEESLFHALKERNLDLVRSLAGEEAMADFLREGILAESEEIYHRMTKERIPPRAVGQDEHLVAPKVAYLQLTRQCNLRCSYCYNRENLCPVDATQGEVLRKILKNLRKAGVETVVFTGGEPMVRKDFPELVERALKEGMCVQVLTNGTRMKDHVDTLQKVHAIIVSIDTVIQDHNLRTGLSVEGLIRDLAGLPEDIIGKTAIRSVITGTHPHDWRAVKNFAEAHGFAFMSTIVMPCGVEDFIHLPPMEALEQEREEISSALGCSSCGASKGILAVDGEGEIYPCQAMMRRPLRLANILDENWKQELATRRKELGIFDRNVNTVEHCSQCKVRYICGGGCMAVSYDVYGDLRRTVKEICPYKMAEAEGKLRGIIHMAGGI
ncbi:MAG: radical SAM protein [Tissierellia bacterium]|nr:radical SAM protein [Tissierellia bacterium]